MISVKANRPKIAWRATAPAILLVSNSFTWYIFAYLVFTEIVNGPLVPETERLLLYATY